MGWKDRAKPATDWKSRARILEVPPAAPGFDQLNLTAPSDYVTTAAPSGLGVDLSPSGVADASTYLADKGSAQMAQRRAKLDAIGKGESFGRGMVSGGTLGFDDEIGGLSGAAVQGVNAAYRTLSGQDPSAWSDLDLADEYAQARDEVRADKAAAEEANPWTYGAGSLVGGAVTTAAPGIAALSAVPKGAGTLTKMAVGARSGAATGALAGAGASEADLTEGDVEGVARDTLRGAEMGGGVGAAIPGAMWLGGKGYDIAKYLAGKGYDLGKWGGQRVLGGATGTPQSVIEYTADNLEKVPNALEPYQMAQRLEDLTEGARSQVSRASGEAQRLLTNKEVPTQDVRDVIDDFVGARLSMGNGQKTDPRLASKMDELGELLTKNKAGSREFRPSSDYTTRIADIEGEIEELAKAAAEARRKAVSGSQGLTTHVNTGFIRQAEKAEKAIADKQLAIERMTALRDKVESTGGRTVEKSTERGLGNFIRQLDREAEASSEGVGAFLPIDKQGLIRMRTAADTAVKQSNPEYAEAMKPVAKMTGALGDFRDAYVKGTGGDTDKLVTRILNNMGKPAARRVGADRALDEFADTFGAPGLRDEMEATAVRNNLFGEVRRPAGSKYVNFMSSLPWVGKPIGAAMDQHGGTIAYNTIKAANRASDAVRTGIDATEDLVSRAAGSKYARVMADAASRGSEALAATHYILQQTDPDYQAHVAEEQ